MVEVAALSVLMMGDDGIQWLGTADRASSRRLRGEFGLERFETLQSLKAHFPGKLFIYRSNLVHKWETIESRSSVRTGYKLPVVRLETSLWPDYRLTMNDRH